MSPGAFQTLQRHLDNSDPQLCQSIRSTNPSFPYDSSSDPAPDWFERAEDSGIDFVRRRQTETIYDELRNRDLDILRRKPTQAQTLWLSPFTRNMGDREEDFSISAFDVYDRKNPPDTELFIQIKKRYCKAKGRFRYLYVTDVFHVAHPSSPYGAHNWPQLPDAPLAKPSSHRLAHVPEE